MVILRALSEEDAMKLLTLSAVTTLALAGSLHTVAAADVGLIPTSGALAMPIAGEPGFDWGGFYAGVYGGLQRSDASGSQAAFGVDAGVNAQFNFYLVGAEVAVHGIAGGDAGTSSYGQILGRAGLIVTDNVAVYAAGGYGMDLGAPDEQDILLGGGVELAVSDRVSIRAQYLHGFPLEGDNAKDQVTVGASYHF